MKNKKNEIEELKRVINYYDYIYRDYSMRKSNKNFSKLKKKIDSKTYKAIVVYPAAISWEPIQRPHHILRVLGEMGYLCFFCVDTNSTELIFEEKYDNVYLINKQEELIPLIGNNRVIVLITYFLQYYFAKFLPNSTIWFDILDRLDFLSLYNKLSKKVYDELIENADIVTYSANSLLEYASRRHDSILLENAVNLDDFKIKEKVNFNKYKDIKRVLDKKKPIVGYYGVVEKWFDFNLIKKLDETNKYSIVIIGPVNEDLEDTIDEYDFENVYFLGMKKYSDLKYYAKAFNIAIIPFYVNKLTNCVSPVKFFEYASMGLPILSTKIREMTKYQCEAVRLIDSNNIIKECDNLLSSDMDLIRKKCNEIAMNNTWEKRVETIEKIF